MSILLIEGDPGELESLSDELRKRNYLGSPNHTLRAELITAPKLNCDQWSDFLHQLHYSRLRYVVRDYMTHIKEDSE